MSDNTRIEWADHTWNPWEGCQKVGPGCDHCYAEARNARFAGGTAINWVPGAPRRRTSVANWRKPLLWDARHAAFAAVHDTARESGKPDAYWTGCSTMNSRSAARISHRPVARSFARRPPDAAASNALNQGSNAAF